jgi:outer membrane PBP1 activator LpoA protein
MLIKNCMVLLMLFAAGCTRAGACDGPQRLCAPDRANTSAAAPGAGGHAAVLLAMADPALAAQAKRASRPASDNAGAIPAGIPAAARADGAPIRIALLLPLRSASLAEAAEAVRAGFMAGFERDGAGFKVELVATGDTPQDALDAYARAAAVSDIVVGPLGRPAVTALAASHGVSQPTVALTVPEARTVAPRAMLVAGLSVEDEAKQIAEWAAREHPHGRALVLIGNAAWAQRAAGAFDARWSELGHTGQRSALPAPNGRVDAAAIDGLRTRLEIDRPDLIFAALDVAELRQVRAATGTAIPCYAGGAANPGRTPGAELAELDGLRLLDLPWMVQPDHPGVMVYPRPLNSAQAPDMDRLYALGIDAFLLARQLALQPGAPVDVDGVTGHLAAGQGASSSDNRLRRREAAAVYHGGVFDPVEQGR